MRKIGILCASDTELAPFLEEMTVFQTTEKAIEVLRGNAPGDSGCGGI